MNRAEINNAIDSNNTQIAKIDSQIIFIRQFITTVLNEENDPELTIEESLQIRIDTLQNKKHEIYSQQEPLFEALAELNNPEGISEY